MSIRSSLEYIAALFKRLSGAGSGEMAGTSKSLRRSPSFRSEALAAPRRPDDVFTRNGEKFSVYGPRINNSDSPPSAGHLWGECVNNDRDMVASWIGDTSGPDAENKFLSGEGDEGEGLKLNSTGLKLNRPSDDMLRRMQERIARVAGQYDVVSDTTGKKSQYLLTVKFTQPETLLEYGDGGGHIVNFYFTLEWARHGDGYPIEVCNYRYSMHPDDILSNLEDEGDNPGSIISHLDRVEPNDVPREPGDAADDPDPDPDAVNAYFDDFDGGKINAPQWAPAKKWENRWIGRANKRIEQQLRDWFDERPQRFLDDERPQGFGVDDE